MPPAATGRSRGFLGWSGRKLFHSLLLCCLFIQGVLKKGDPAPLLVNTAQTAHGHEKRAQLDCTGKCDIKRKNRLKASFTGTLTCGSAQVEYDLGDLTSAGWHLTPPHDSQPKTHNANGQPGKATGISFFI